MTNEMIERVAKAIDAASQPPSQKDYKLLMENAARAAIEAMREPTVEMLVSAQEEWNVTMTECPWLKDDLPTGTIVHPFNGCTYGCVGAGIAVTRERGETPFFEIPRDAVTTNPDNHNQ